MRKILTIVAATILFAVSANAQTFINLGYGLGWDKTTFGPLETDATNSNAIFAGASHNFGIAGNFGIEPGLNYVFNFSKLGDELGVKNQYHGLQLPVLFNYAIVPSDNFTFKLFVGPSANFGISDKSTTYVGGVTGSTVGIVIDNYADDSYSRFGLAASFGLAAELFETVRIKVGYDLGLLDLNKADKIVYKQNMLTFSFGYIF